MLLLTSQLLSQTPTITFDASSSSFIPGPGPADSVVSHALFTSVLAIVSIRPPSFPSAFMYLSPIYSFQHPPFHSTGSMTRVRICHCPTPKLSRVSPMST